MEIEIINHQDCIEITDATLAVLTTQATRAIPFIQEKIKPQAPWAELELIEIAIVDDETSAATHEQFMNIAGATDVITFHHGEIVISAEVAQRQSEEFADTFPNELLRYIVHGMLHLAGYDDLSPEEFEEMKSVQEKILQSILDC